MPESRQSAAAADRETREQAGLRARFADPEVEIANNELDAIIMAAEGHPRRTMFVASRVRASVEMQPDGLATPTLVELAIQEAEQDRSWR
jgi:hypothetical protein